MAREEARPTNAQWLCGRSRRSGSRGHPLARDPSSADASPWRAVGVEALEREGRHLTADGYYRPVPARVNAGRRPSEIQNA